MQYLFESNIQEKTRGKVDEELNKRLKAVVAEDIKRLEKIIDRDLSAWL